MSPVVTDYRRHGETLLSVRENDHTQWHRPIISTNYRRDVVWFEPRTMTINVQAQRTLCVVLTAKVPWEALAVASNGVYRPNSQRWLQQDWIGDGFFITQNILQSYKAQLAAAVCHEDQETVVTFVKIFPPGNVEKMTSCMVSFKMSTKWIFNGTADWHLKQAATTNGRCFGL